jgi:hypothetical protein
MRQSAPTESTHEGVGGFSSEVDTKAELRRAQSESSLQLLARISVLDKLLDDQPSLAPMLSTIDRAPKLPHQAQIKSRRETLSSFKADPQLSSADLVSTILAQGQVTNLAAMTASTGSLSQTYPTKPFAKLKPIPQFVSPPGGSTTDQVGSVHSMDLNSTAYKGEHRHRKKMRQLSFQLSGTACLPADEISDDARTTARHGPFAVGEPASETRGVEQDLSPPTSRWRNRVVLPFKRDEFFDLAEYRSRELSYQSVPSSFLTTIRRSTQNGIFSPSKVCPC